MTSVLGNHTAISIKPFLMALCLILFSYTGVVQAQEKPQATSKLEKAIGTANKIANKLSGNTVSDTDPTPPDAPKSSEECSQLDRQWDAKLKTLRNRNRQCYHVQIDRWIAGIITHDQANGRTVEFCGIRTLTANGCEGYSEAVSCAIKKSREQVRACRATVSARRRAEAELRAAVQAEHRAAAEVTKNAQQIVAEKEKTEENALWGLGTETETGQGEERVLNDNSDNNKNNQVADGESLWESPELHLLAGATKNAQQIVAEKEKTEENALWGSGTETETGQGEERLLNDNSDNNKNNWDADNLDEEMKAAVEKERKFLAGDGSVLPDVASDYTNSIGMAFKNIPAGSFRMGDLSGDSGYYREKPVHTVRISPFEMGAHEVTVGQFRAFVEDSGYDAGNSCRTYEDGKWKERSGRSWRSPGFTQSNRHPVVCVSYDDAQAFIAWLNQKTGGGYRLPTEAEWEYAARAGTTSKYSWGNSESQADAYAWHRGNSGKRTHAVGGKKPNPWGLYDMQGNVHEWVQDWHGWDYYANSPATDPQGPSSGEFRMFRSGGFLSSNSSSYLRSAYRGGWSAGHYDSELGFRLVRQP